MGEWMKYTTHSRHRTVLTHEYMAELEASRLRDSEHIKEAFKEFIHSLKLLFWDSSPPKEGPCIL
jgi:hypothetical protein